MEAEFPTERWFWFDPRLTKAVRPLHKQPDGVWRIDLQLGWDVDKDEEKTGNSPTESHAWRRCGI